MNPIMYIYPFKESYIDYPDDISTCLDIFFLGCDNNCTHCSNPNLQKKDLNIKDVNCTYNINWFMKLIRQDCYKSKINHITFIGGDCLCKENISATKRLLLNLKNEFEICIYTGHSVDYAMRNHVEGFSFLKTGKYLEEYKQEATKNDEYMQFASTNQQLYDGNYNLLSENGRYYFM